MKKMLISIVILFTGCVGVWHGNPYGEQTREGTDITRKRGTQTPWWQERQSVATPTSACVCATNSATKWDLDSFDSVMFPPDWVEKHPTKPKVIPTPTPAPRALPSGEVY